MCSSPVLEVGCGTGRVLVPLAKKGVHLVGLDFSEGMLSKCRSKLELIKDELKYNPELIHGDMRTAKLNRSFPIIIIPFNTFLHLDSLEDQLLALKNLNDHLEPNGIIIIEIFVPKVSTLHEWHNKTIEFSLDPRYKKTYSDCRLKIKQTIYYDTLSQRCEWTYVIDKCRRKGKSIETLTVNGSSRYMWKNEFELVLRLARVRE